MVDPGVEKHFSLGGETVLLIEAQGVRLSVQRDFRHSLLRSPTQKFAQDSAPDTTPAPRGQHRHPPDVPVGQQPAGPDRRAVHVFGQHLTATCVRPVPFQSGRNVLLADEDRFPDAPQVFVVALPVSATHAKGRAHAGDYNGRRRHETARMSFTRFLE